MSRYKKTRKALIFWCLFIGLGAVLGSTCMFIDPTGGIMGMDAVIPYFQVLPFADILFQNLIFSGFALLIVNGISNLVVALLLFKNKKSGIVLGCTFGITLMMWITIQFVIFPMNFMSTIYFIFGIIQAITGYMCFVFYKQETFDFKEEDYKNISKDSDTIVIYFSRMNYTKKIAYSIADNLKANIYEIKSTEKTDGTLGFWWCGRYGMHQWNMPIEKLNIDLSKYKKIVICSPIWVFGISAPMRTFIEENNKLLNNSDIVLVHFNKMTYNYVISNIETKYNIKFNNKKTICSRLGKQIYNKDIK